MTRRKKWLLVAGGGLGDLARLAAGAALGGSTSAAGQPAPAWPRARRDDGESVREGAAETLTSLGPTAVAWAGLAPQAGIDYRASSVVGYDPAGRVAWST